MLWLLAGGGNVGFSPRLVEVVMVASQTQKRNTSEFQSIRTITHKATKEQADWFITGIELAGYGKVGC